MADGARESGLNPDQLRAVQYGDGPLMVLAGAGSGKTRVLVHRIAALVQRGVPAPEVLAVTFTNKAAGEMRQRLEALLGLGAQRMWIGTFHATCARILRIFHREAGLPATFTIFDDDDQLKVVKTLLADHGLKDQVTPRTVLSMIDRAKNRGEDPVEAAAGSYSSDVIATIYPDYEARLRQEEAVDFNDLLLRVLDLAEHPDVGPQLRSRFRHVLVDEFQDTNRVQYRLVKQFIGGTRNLTVVGDDDQSIYSWRGAEPRNLLDFDRDFADAEVVKLEQNYRSTSVILNAANSVIANNLDRHAKELWTEREGGEPVLWEECADERAEADFVARGIQGLVAEEGRDWGDIAVLYRTHAQSRVLEEMLRANGVDYRIVGGVSFFQRKEVKDVRAYLRLILTEAADTAFERIINVPARGIGKTTVDRVRNLARNGGLSMFESARACAAGQSSQIRPAAQKKLRAFVDLIDGLRDVCGADASVAELIIQTVERSGYRQALERDDSIDASDRIANLSELVAMASDFDDEVEGGDLAAFEERISLASANDERDGRGAAVTLMTIHAAKGLEFPVVFVSGMEDGLFPSLRERPGENERDALEEERRLAYVAFTRAMDRLVLTSARVRRVWAEIRVTEPSRFLDEIDSECLAVRARPDPDPQARARPSRRARDPEYDEFDQRTPYEDDLLCDVPADVDIDLTGAELGAGATVEHSSFGTGRVIEARGSGKDRKLLIDFSSVGLKTVLARFVEPVL